VRVGVGTGFNDVQREEFWKDRSKIIGKQVTVKFQRKSPDGSLIFPVFMRIRDQGRPIAPADGDDHQTGVTVG